MDFSEKLNFLFELTQSEGKALASAMNVTPPQISKMRKGRRGLPKDREYARVLAGFFARQCTSAARRNALSMAMKVEQVKSITEENALTDILLDWLADQRGPDDYAARRAGDFLRQFGAPAEESRPAAPEGDSRRVLTTGGSDLIAYYGSEGKRVAVQTFLFYLLHCRQPCVINILTDENTGWMTEDPKYSKLLQDSLLRLTDMGCTFRRVAVPITDIDEAFESLNRWLPLYLTGKATSYYYKRMRDSLNHLTLFVVPHTCVMFSFSVGNVPQKDGVTFFTTDEKTVGSLATEFENYISLCEPIMNVYNTENSPKRISDCMLAYESCKGRCIQRSNSLSYITLPWDVATSLQTDCSEAVKQEFLTGLAQRYKSFKANIEKYYFTDIIRLASPEDVLAGRVPIPAALVLGDSTQYYTPAAYVQHLRSILYLLEHQENYRVVLRTAEDCDPTVIYVKEGYSAILMRTVYPFTIFEVSEHYLVQAFTEFLRRSIPLGPEALPNKRKVIGEIRGLIEQVERMTRSARRRSDAAPPVR